MRYLVLLLVLLCPSLALAEEPQPVQPIEGEDVLSEVYFLQYLPRGRRVTLLGEKLHAFDFDEYMVLLEMDSDLHKCKQDMPELKGTVVALRETVASQKDALKSANEAKVIAINDAADAHKTITTEIPLLAAELQQAEHRNKIAWGVAGGTGALALGLILGLIFGGS